jgi:glutamyl-tRNA reductase
MDINQFYIAGINYKKTDASVRGSFAVSNQHYEQLLTEAASARIEEVFVLSTCNRTEIYGVAANADTLITLLCRQTAGSAASFKKLAYIKRGWEAVEHLFQVAAGLDSQILGDYEIVGQIKLAVRFARERGFIGTLLERLLSFVLQSSKNIKSNTALSGGTVSVAFAAIQFLKENTADVKHKKIVLIGTGKIGKNTCKNLIDYLEATNITLINRTEEKAGELANELGVQYDTIENLPAQIEKADIILVATNAPTPIITKKQLLNAGKKVLIDLSIPNNIAPAAGELPQITLVNVDDLSKINDATLQKRMDEVPAALGIIATHTAEFKEWYQMRKNVPALKAVKQKLMDMHQCNLFLSVHTDVHQTVTLPNTVYIQKTINNMASKMRTQHQPGCYFIEAINDYITCTVN